MAGDLIWRGAGLFLRGSDALFCLAGTAYHDKPGSFNSSCVFDIKKYAAAAEKMDLIKGETKK